MDWIKATVGFLIGYIVLGGVLYSILGSAIPGLNITENNFKLLVGLLAGYQAGKS
jgi:hypothetical protein